MFQPIVDRRGAIWRAVVFSCLVILGLQARAREALSSDPSDEQEPILSAGSEGENPTGFSSKDPLSFIISGDEYVSKYRTKIPTMKQARKFVCPALEYRRYPRTNLCSIWDQADRSFEAAGKALGVPASALACLMKQESNMSAHAISPANARGLTQFTQSPARGYERIVHATPAYRKAWEMYQAELGTRKPLSQFNRSTIRSTRLSDFDVQIFATAVYFRDSLQSYESRFRSELGTPPEPNAAGLRKLYHFLLISYNSTALRAKKYLYGGLSRAHLKAETAGYLTKFDHCIATAATK